MISPSAGKPLYNSRITNTYLKLIKKRYSYIDIEDLLDYAGMELQQVADEGHWFNQEQVNRFQERLRYLSGNNDIAREAGAYTASPEVLGGIRRYLLGLVSPANAYAMVGKYTNKFSRSSRVEAVQTGSNKVEVLVVPYEGVKEESFQCENRQGYLEAVSRIFNYKSPRIEHPECLFKGGKQCRYIVSWQESKYSRWKKIRNIVAPALIALSIISPFEFTPYISLSIVLPYSITLFSILIWYVSFLYSRELKSAVDNLQESSDELIEQININYENSLLINEIGQVLSKQLDLNGLLSNIAGTIQKRLDYDRGLILMANHDSTRLMFRAGYGYDNEQLQLLKRINFHLDNPKSEGVFVVAFREQIPVLLNDINEVKNKLSSRSYEFALKMGAKSFICCPIVYENKSVGILAVDNLQTKRPLLERDKNLLMGVANQIAISFNNANLIEARLRQFQSMLQVLAASTDARDPITAGHSLKVTEYAVGISRELGLEPDYCDMIRVAAMLHDYGKIGVEDAILKKPGRLDDREYEIIQTHALKTKDILEKIQFEDLYREVPLIAGSHHEKIDGSGYPCGLKGDEIPLGARIIAVADVFEALTSKRHYRNPMMINEAFDLLVDGAGSHFDPVCVEAMINYYNMFVADIPYLHEKPYRERIPASPDDFVQ